ncbi:MAG TPA: hypothetical protein VMI52_10245 [Acetobacteraceae bacterium]|nr:hypothetical protein [Acetobacteraceae bacterium]
MTPAPCPAPCPAPGPRIMPGTVPAAPRRYPTPGPHPTREPLRTPWQAPSPGRHPLDPAAAHSAAAVLGGLVGRGLLSREESLEALSQSWRHAPVDPAGLRARLAHRLLASARATLRARHEAAAAVETAVRRLLRIGAPRATLLQAAQQAADGALSPAETEATVLLALAAYLGARAEDDAAGNGEAGAAHG